MGAWDSGETIETHGKQGVTFSQPRQPFASQPSKGINFKRKLVRPFGDDSPNLNPIISPGCIQRWIRRPRVNLTAGARAGRLVYGWIARGLTYQQLWYLICVKKWTLRTADSLRKKYQSCLVMIIVKCLTPEGGRRWKKHLHTLHYLHYLHLFTLFTSLCGLNLLNHISQLGPSCDGWFFSQPAAVHQGRWWSLLWRIGSAFDGFIMGTTTTNSLRPGRSRCKKIGTFESPSINTSTGSAQLAFLYIYI